MQKQFSTFQKYFLYFFLYSVIGWCYEVFLEVFIYRLGFSNRGFLFGPYTPVYGFGAVLFLLLLSNIKKNPIYIGKLPITPLIIFMLSAVIATIVELLTSYALDFISAGKLWDYSNYAWNFQGRIALNPSVRFGLGGVFFLYVMQPIFEKNIDLLSAKNLSFIFTVLSGLMLADLMIKILQMI